MVFTIRTQEQVLTRSSYVLVCTSLGPEHNVYFKKKLKVLFLILYLVKEEKQKKEIKNQSNEDRRVEIHLKEGYLPQLQVNWSSTEALKFLLVNFLFVHSNIYSEITDSSCSCKYPGFRA